MRRKGQDFEHTPMGFITTGKPLVKDHPFFQSLASTGASEAPKVTAAVPEAEENEDESDDDVGHDSDEESMAGDADDGAVYRQELPEEHEGEGVFYDAVEHSENEDEFHDADE
jgi:hypothetical protein